MKRFILSAFSVLLVTAAVAPTAQALPTIDPAFNIQTRRLREFDARNKADYGQQPYETYEQQTPAQTTPQTVTVGADQPTSADSTEWEETKWEDAEAQSEANAQSLSLIEKRQEVLDRS